ncbi:MAG: hypothetical protein ACKO8Z_16135 [Prosthecobacter sp.]
MSARTWFLLKASDKEIFGPTDLATLKSWAAEAKISPLDKISSDNRESWNRSPMIPELQMDLLIQMPDNYLYGPTNVAAIQEFLATGEIDENVTIINCLDNTESRLGDLVWFQASPRQTRSASTTFQGTGYDRSSTNEDAAMRRIAALERQSMELQRAVDEWQQAYLRLKQQYIESVGREPL